MKVLIVLPKARLLKYRLPLINEMIFCGYDVGIAAPYDSKYHKLISQSSFRFYNFRIIRRESSLKSELLTIFDLNKIINSFKPNLILNTTIKPNIYGSIIAKINSVKIVTSMVTGLGDSFVDYNNNNYKIKNYLIYFLYRISSAFNDKIIFQNNDDMNFFLSKKFVKEPKVLCVNGTGVDLNDYNEKKQNYKNGMVFSFFSRLLIAKGIREFAEAGMYLIKNYSNVEINIAGPISNGNEYVTKEEINRWIDAGIKYHGFKENIKNLIDDSSVIVLPSYYPEGVPRILIEGAAKGKALITTNRPGCKETIDEGLNGFFVREKNVNDLIKKMEILLNNPKLVLEMGKQSRKHAIKKFDVNVNNRKIIQFLFN